MKYQFVYLNYERTVLRTAGATGRKELCVTDCYCYYYYYYYYYYYHHHHHLILLPLLLLLRLLLAAGERAALAEKNFKGKEKRAAHPATILPDG